ncbi:MAG: hypothetical protein Q9225_002233 [Loekoesia sp. 1 TL-2023]
MASSFRRDGKFPPLRYRTPSPPTHAFEPLSPFAHHGSGAEAPPLQGPIIAHSQNASMQPTDLRIHKNSVRRGQPIPTPQDTMDTFASIALSTNPEWPAHNKRNTSTTPPSQEWSLMEENVERSSKRARSEKLSSPEWTRGQSKAASRPASSYESIADNRRMEAELLLNFSQAARFSTPSIMAPYNPYASRTGYPGSRSSRQQDPPPEISSQKRLYYSESHNIGPEVRHKGDGTAQDTLGPSTNAPGPSINIPAMNGRMTQASETPLDDCRHQLAEASKALQHQVDPLKAAESICSAAAPRHVEPFRRESRLMVEDNLLHDASAQKSREKTGTVVEGRSEDAGLGNAFKAYKDLQDRAQPSFTDQEDQISANDYWPSMLATTVEKSASAWEHRLAQALEELGAKGQQTNLDIDKRPIPDTTAAEGPYAQEPATCAACKFARNSMNVETDGEPASWISCDGCKSWFHFACAGFKSEREVRGVDKYRCRKCKAIYGPTTYVRKSARAHTAIDYAGLNQGVVKTSDERPEHHYIKPIKDGTLNLQPENFARMRPELVTAEYFEKGNGMKEPIVIPAEFNPRPRPAGSPEPSPNVSSESIHQTKSDATLLDDWFARDPECQNVSDHGQDALDMVIPPNLTVRKVAQLYGPEEKVEVIDVKSQNGEGKKWNMRRWADYYENNSNKVVRNVISLEVSQSTLGRLIRRPQIVRELDLQDSVWPAELQAKGEFPRVQFYCLMSVADCFTDFHIDFGGSSVFYHILKGRKTFFFIPPKEKHLKKYEEWCMSPAQNWTFLADQTKECYRVDLLEGDTMLIPAGWIHAVWTPEDSLVIGGNFLTRLNYSMQLRIAQIEKATGVARKFRYPHFQKIQWYTAIRYLENDPLPSSVRTNLQAGGVFCRQYPAYHDFDTWGENSRSGPENYHARYYSQPELEGLPDLVRYLLRTALIDSGDITEGITAETRNAVKKSIPRGFGEPLEIVKNFALWSAWKRGNESVPHWAYPDAVPEILTTDSTAKLNAASLKKLDRETAPQEPRRRSSRNHIQQPLMPFEEVEASYEKQNQNNDGLQSDNLESSNLLNSEPLADESLTSYKIPLLNGESQQHSKTANSTKNRKRKVANGATTTTPRKTACESCRQRRRACKHQIDRNYQFLGVPSSTTNAGDGHQDSEISFAPMGKTSPETNAAQNIWHDASSDKAADRFNNAQPASTVTANVRSTSQTLPNAEATVDNKSLDAGIHNPPPNVTRASSPPGIDPKHAIPVLQKKLSQKPLGPKQSRGRSKACNDCRKSKRRCLHDENGKEDPLKVQEAAAPRHINAPKRRKLGHDTQSNMIPFQSHPTPPSAEAPTSYHLVEPSAMHFQEEVQRPAPPAVMVAESPPVNVTTNDEPPSSDDTHQPQPSEQSLDVQGFIQTRAPTDISPAEAKNLTPPSVPEQETGGAQFGVQEPVESLPSGETQQPASTIFDISARISSGSGFEKPPASSLVSPPASSHDESEQPIPAADPKATSSGFSSRHSSRHPMQTQRFTPESGPARRDSSSSIVVDATSAEAVKSPSTSPVSGQTPDSPQKRTRVRLGSDFEADEESLKLIKALQAEDYGLRRRSSRVP